MSQQFQPLVVNADLAPVKKQKRTLREKVNAWGGAVVYGPWRTAKRRRVSLPLAGLLLVGAGVGAWLALRPVPKPDFDKDRLDRLFKFALLTDEFNRLPVQERLELVGSLYRRMQAMDGNESLLLAAFASGVRGKAREQFMENVSRLMVDAADMFATEYRDVPEEDRERFLEECMVRFVELGAAFEGKPNTKPREEIIADAKEQGSRDAERMKENPLSTRQSLHLFDIGNETIGNHATPQQKARIGPLIRDMTRHFRGQDIRTGKPKGGG